MECAQPKWGNHRCIVTLPHKVHMCRCVKVWNEDALSPKQYRENQDGTPVTTPPDCPFKAQSEKEEKK